MKIKYYIDLIRGKTAALNPARLSPSNIWAVIQSFLRSLLPLPSYLKEQIVWRRLQVIEKSPTCWVAGHCVQCGCEMVGKTMADEPCDNPPFCFPPMMSRKEWKEYKKIKGIRIFDKL